MPKKDVREMDVIEIKKKIMDRIEKERSRSSRKKKILNLATLSEKMGRPEGEVLRLFNQDPLEEGADEPITPPFEAYGIPEKPVKEYRSKLLSLEEENLKLKKIQEEARFKSDSLLSDIEEKDRAIAELQKKLEHESIGLMKEDEHKSLINSAIEKSIAEYRTKLASLEEENDKLKSLHSKELKENESVFLQIAEKDKEIEELKNRFERELAAIDKQKEIELGKSFEEYREKISPLETENKKLKRLHEDALRQSDGLLIRIEEKDQELREAQKKISELEIYFKKHKDNEKAMEEAKVEKEKAASNVEALRSKLYAATKDQKEQANRIGQLEEMLKHRDKKLSDSEKVCKNIENEKNEAILRLQASEEAKRALTDKLAALGDAITAAEKRLAEGEKHHAKSLDAARKEMELQTQALERSRKALEGKITQLNVELEAKNKRIEETEKINAELDGLVKESAIKLQSAEGLKNDLEERMREIDHEIKEASKKREADTRAADENIAKIKEEIGALKNVVKDKERAEAELSENILRLETEIEARDKKIQSDIKYCEDVVREVNELRQKIKNYRLKAR